MMRGAGATEVHMRISSPPTSHSCFYGIDTPERKHLLASRMNVNEMAGVHRRDSLAFITIDGLYRAMGHKGRDNLRPQFCDARFTGDYPTTLTDQTGGDGAHQLSLWRNAPDAARGRSAPGRIALVTGASRGIGAAVARRFAREGADLVLIARTVGGLEELDDAVRKNQRQEQPLVPLDLRDFDAIDRLGQALYERFGRLDVLVGNAGLLGTLSPIGHISPKEFQEVLDVNLTANWRLIRSLDPLLRQSEAGRAVFVTSGGPTSASIGVPMRFQGSPGDAGWRLCPGKFSRPRCGPT